MRATRQQLDREQNKRAGCVALAYSRRSGTLRGVYRAAEQGLEGEGWATICEDHSTLVISETRALAMASDTPDFCDECRAYVLQREAHAAAREAVRAYRAGEAVLE